MSVLLFTERNEAQSSRILVQTYQATGRLSALGRSLYRQQTAVREYLRTGDPKDLAIFRELRGFWDDDFHQTFMLLNDSERQVFSMRTMEKDYHDWLLSADEIVKSPRTVSTAELQRDASLFERAFMDIDGMIGFENRQFMSRAEANEQAITSMFIAIIAVQFLLLLVSAWALWWLSRVVVQPIAHLSSMAEHYQRGDFSARAKISSNDQIGFLGSNFNAMAEKINAMVTDLRKLDELKSEFIATVSHELKTPLTTISGYVKLLLKGEGGNTTEKQKEFLEIVDSNASRLDKLINDILDVEKMESGKMQVARKTENLAAILQECRDTFEVLARNKGLEFRYRVPSDFLPVLGDRKKLVQIFVNLLSNAIKYTETGFVALEADLSGFGIKVSVRDSGIGLTAEEQERIFQKFYHPRTSADASAGGAGLGLVIARGLAEAHGGTMEVLSEPGRGTLLTVSLPLREEEVKAQGYSVGKGSCSPVSRGIVWIIDRSSRDSQQMISLVENELSKNLGTPMRARRFVDIDQIPKLRLQEESPVAIVLGQAAENDYMNLKQLRRRVHHRVPILALDLTIDPRVALAQGASSSLTKPLNLTKLASALANLILSKGLRVLIAHTDTDYCLLLKREIHKRGIEADDIQHGNQVVGRLEQERYDLVLMEASLPDVSGEDVLGIIRKSTGLALLPVVLLHESDRDIPAADVDSLTRWIDRNTGIDDIADVVMRIMESEPS